MFFILKNKSLFYESLQLIAGFIDFKTESYVNNLWTKKALESFYNIKGKHFVLSNCESFSILILFQKFFNEHNERLESISIVSESIKKG